jgi:hypothetical protein
MKYKVPLAELVVSVRVPLDDLVQMQETAASPENDESVGHLPGTVRPYGA